MPELRILSASEQVAQYIREQLSRRIWTGTIPGGVRLARELGVGRMTLEAALIQLEDEGILIPQGVGKRRLISLPDSLATPSLKVGILLYAPDDRKIYYNVDLQHRLLNAGHSASFASKTLTEMGMDSKRIARFVESSPADAWVVSSASRDVLEWFANQKLPTFAFAGRRRHVRIASIGPDKEVALRTLMRRLYDYGHRRIVMLTRDIHRNPTPSAFVEIFLDELTAHGIQHGDYNIPNWREDGDGLKEVLDGLFRVTPPTAMIIVESSTFAAVQQHLAQRGILAPRDISLICDDPDPVFSMCRPTVAHIHWDGAPVAKRAVQWADNVARGKDDRRMSFFEAKLIEGGTLGPAPKKR